MDRDKLERAKYAYDRFVSAEPRMMSEIIGKPVLGDPLMVEVEPGDVDVLRELFGAEHTAVIRWDDVEVEIKGRLLEYEHLEIDGREYLGARPAEMAVGITRAGVFLDVSLNVSI